MQILPASRIHTAFSVAVIVLLPAAISLEAAEDPPESVHLSSFSCNTVSPHRSTHHQSTCGCGSYWAVSTHASDQEFSEDCPVFRPCVTQITGDGRRSSSDLQGLLHWLKPGVPVCIHVHGSFAQEDELRQEESTTYRWLQTASRGCRVQMIKFKWPSSRPILLPTYKFNVNLLGRRAARNGWYLADLIRHLPPNTPVCLLGHSHGCRVIASALHLMGGGTVQGKRHPGCRSLGRRIRVVMAAAAIRHDWLNPEERYGRALCSAECLLNLQTRHDYALALYPLRHPFSGHSLGSTGVTRKDRRKLQGWSAKIIERDVTSYIGHQHMWPSYVARREIAWMIRNYLFFTDRSTAYTMTERAKPAESDSHTIARDPVSQSATPVAAHQRDIQR